MSKKNNKMSKKNNRKNYKIESLEPRLMMDATANDWINELDTTFDLSATTSINSSTNEYKNWLNTDIQTLFVEDSIKGQRIAKVSDLIENDKNALDWLLFVDTNGTHDDLKEIMSSAVNSLKSDYTNFCIQNDNTYKKLRDGSANGTEKSALLLKLNAQVQNYFNTKMFSTSELLPLLNSSPKNTKYTFRQGVNTDEIVVDILEGKNRTTTNGLSANLAGFSGVATNLLPIVTDYARSYTLKLDGQGKVVLDNPSIAVASSFRQYTEQDVKNESDPNNKEKLEESRNSNGHVLEFKSIADDDDSAPDYYMGLGLSAAGVHELVIGDLDFQVSEPSKIAGLTSTGKLKYQYDKDLRTWKWIGANDVDKVEHASMGLILQKLSELSLWLSKNSTVTPENPIPLLYDSFAGTINQNATENANLSAFLDELLNTPPTSLQELYEKMYANNRITLNGNSLSLAFSLSIPASVQNVSVAVEELTKLGFDVTRNESLSLVSNPKLDFTLNVDLSAQIRADENTDLKDSVAAIEYTEFFGKETVSVDNPFAITGLLQIDENTWISALGIDNETGLSFFMDSRLSDACQDAIFVQNIAPVASPTTPSIKYIVTFTKKDSTTITEEYLCNGRDELISALQSSFAEKKMHIYYFSSINHFVVVNENDCEYASFVINNGTLSFPFAEIHNVKIVENSPVNVNTGDIVITLNDGSSVTISVDASNYLDRESVVKQINNLLDGSVFSASLKNNRLVFENNDNDKTHDKKFTVSGSFFALNGLFAGVTQKSSTSVCLTVTVEHKMTGTKCPIPIDLVSWFDNLSQSEQDSLKLVDVLDKICALSGNVIKRDGVRLVGTEDYNLVEIETVNGSLAAVLGLTGNADDGARFKLDALLLEALNSISYKKFNLSIEQTLSGNVDIDARVGLIEDHFYTENSVDMGHKVELKYDDSKGLAQLPDANVLAIHQSVAKLASDFENAYNSFTSCLSDVFDGSSIKLGSLASSFVNLLQSIDDFVNSTKKLKDGIENIWNYVDSEYGLMLSSFVSEKDGYVNNLKKILEDVLVNKTPGYGTVLQAYINNPKIAITQIVSLLQNLDDCKDEFDRIFTKSISSYVQNLRSHFLKIASTIETALGVSNWNVSKTALAGKTNGLTVKDSVTKGNNLGDFTLKNAVTSLNDTVQSLNGGTSIAAALNWKKIALSDTALKMWSGVELGDAMLAASSSFAQEFLGFDANGEKLAGAKSLFENMDVLTQEIPFIGKSIIDLCGFNAKMEEFRRVLGGANNLTLQGFATQLLDRIGLSMTNFIVEESAKNTIKIDFEWKYEVKNGTFVLNNLGDDSFHIGGALDVNLNVSLTFKIRMVLEYDALATKKIKVSFVPVEEGGVEQKIVDARASIEKSPLTGNLHVYYKLGGKSFQAPLVEIVDGSKISLSFICGINLDSATTLGLSIANANVDADGRINIRVAGQDAGVVEIGGNVDLKKDGIGKLIPSVTRNSVPNKSGLWVDGSKIKLDFSFGSLYEQMRLVSDSLSQMLRRAISGINKEVLRDSVRSIPFIGDRIVAAADCLTKLDEKFIEPFRNYVNIAQNLNAEMVALKLYNLLKNAEILGTLADCSQKDPTTGSVGVTWGGKNFDKYYKGIQYCESGDEACWRIQIGGKYDLDPNADFDLGFPGLGLHSEGGLNISLDWSLDIGFGVSNNGAFLLLATDQDEVKISLNVNTKENFKVDGSLGFMKMSLKQGADTGFEDGGFGVKLNVDLNDQKTNPTVDVHNVGSGIAVKAKLAATLQKTWNLALSAGEWFPEIDADLYIDWSAATGAASNGLNELSFKNVTFKGGKFIDKTVMPVLKNIQKVIEPIQPLIKFLQSEIPVLNKLPAGKVHITVLDLIKMYGSGKDMDFGFIDDIIQINNLIQSIKTGQSLDLELPNMELWKTPDKALSTADAGIRNAANNASLDFLSGASKNIDSYVQKLRETFTIGSKQLSASYQTQLNKLRDAFSDFDTSSSSSASLTTGGGRGWSFPILDNPLTEIAGLLFGRDATLVTYNMSPLKFNFDWKNSYPIVGPLCADIGFNFGVCIDLTFGYDTHGLTRWKNSDYKNIALLIDGFYIADWNEDGKDTAEVVFHSGVVAGASICGRAGINVGLNFDVNLDFNDPNNDGKIRLGEMADMLRANPLLIFNASATIDVEAYAYLDYFVGRKKWTLWSSGAFELFNTASKASKDPIMVSDNGDYLVVNVGEFASGRNSGNLGDGDDEVTIVFTDARKGTVSWNGSKAYEFDLGNDPNALKGICVYAGLGSDKITIKSNVAEVAADIIVYGGDGDDVIDASGLQLAEGFNAMLVGGVGIDRITGAAGNGNNFIFGEGGRYVLDDETKKKVLLAETLPVDGDVSGNVLTGGSGRNFVFGGEGGDVIYAGTGLNYLFGDRGHVDLTGTIPVASRYDLFDEGDDDLIYGSEAGDYIYSGAGNDWIESFGGDDEIHAGQGNDIVFGGNGVDTIHGGDGDDLIFGDTPFNLSMDISGAGLSTSVLPYAYVSEEFKKTNHPLYDATNKKIALTTPDEHYLNRFDAKYGATRKQSSVTAVNSMDKIYGENGADIIFGDDGKNQIDLEDGETLSANGHDIIDGGADNDFIDGDAGNDQITGGSGDDVIYGGQGNDQLDGGAGDDIVFGDDGLAGYLSSVDTSSNWFGQNDDDANKLIFGETIKSFQTNFGVKYNAVARSEGGEDSIVAGNGSDIVDGQSGNDHYEVNFMGSYNKAYTNIIESGSDVNDTLTVNGTLDADDVLIRRSDSNKVGTTNVKLGLVALLPDKGNESTADSPKAEKSQIERINFWNSRLNSGLEKMTVNTGAGNDTVSIDGTLTAIAIDAGAGNDTINVGQMFKSEREANNNTNIKNLDHFATTETTEGYLSNGVEHSTTIFGGSGNDVFNVAHTSAAIALSGGTGDDSFNISTFQKADADGNPDGVVQNAPVTVIGGAGNDSMSVSGTEADDTFVISDGSIQSSGVNVQAVSIENQNAYGGAGDDEFYVLDTAKDSVVQLNGNEGNDSFYNGGSQSDLSYIAVDNVDYKGHSGIIAHSVISNTDKYKQNKTNSIAVNIRDNDVDSTETQTVLDILFTDKTGNVVSDPHAVIKEGNGQTVVYGIKLSKAPAENETVSVTVYAPEMTTEKHQHGDRGAYLVNSDGTYVNSVTFSFTSKNYNVAQYVNMIAFSDNLREGDDHFALLHGVATGVNTKVNPCRNVVLFLEDDRAAQKIINADPLTIDSNRNAFTETLSLTIGSVEAKEHKAIKGLRSRADVDDIFVWYQGMPDGMIFETRFEGQNDLIIKWDDSIIIPEGTVLFVNYTARSMELDNTSTANLKYEAKESDIGWMVLGTDYSFSSMTKYDSSASGDATSGDGISYAIDADNSLLVYKNGNLLDVNQSGFVMAWVDQPIVPQNDCIEIDSGIYGLEGLTATDAAGASCYLFYTDLYTPINGYYFVQTGNVVKIYQKTDVGSVDVTTNFNGGMLRYRVAYWVGGTSGKIVPQYNAKVVDTNDEKYALKFFAGNEYVIYNHRQKNPDGSYSEEGYFFRIEGSQVIVCSNKTGLPVTVSGCLSIERRTLMNVADETYAWEASSAEDLSKLGSGNVDAGTVGKVVITQTSGSTDVEEGGYTDTYAISLNGENLVGKETVKVEIDPVSTPFFKVGDEQTPENLKKDQQVKIESISYIEGDKSTPVYTASATTSTQNSKITIEFNKDRCKGYFLVTVMAIDDKIAESDNPTLVPVGERTIENILGAVFENGAGDKPESSSGNPSMLRYLVPTDEISDEKAEKNIAENEDGTNAEEQTVDNVDDFDESKSVDRVFVNNMDNLYDATSSTKALSSSKTRATSAKNPKLIDAEKTLVASDSHSVRFTHTDKNHKDAKDNIAKNISFGNMEYGEINLGTGVDTVDINKSIYREDGFQTFTVVNSGKGGDTINVKSYKDGVDDQLVINAGEGDDKILATDTEKVTKSGLIVFGGLGNDEIDIRSESSLVFGDRGQVLYHDAEGNVVTRLGDNKTGTFIGKEKGAARNAGGSDYATGKNKGDEAYFQTDGTRYGASIARTVTEDQGGHDTIKLVGGRNVVFGGENKTDVDNITTGNGKDLVFGDNGYTTFQGRSDVAKGLGMENMPTIYSEATLSFNFQGPAQNGIGANEEAGAVGDYTETVLNKETGENEEHSGHVDYRAVNWNNIKGHEAGTYGDNDDEIVLFDNGSRASAVSVTYGASEEHRVNTTDGDNIRLHGYTQEGRISAYNPGDYNLMKSGLDTSGNNARNTLLAQVDGLNQYFTDYDVVVYLDMVQENSWAQNSVRVVTLYRDYVENGVARSEWVMSYYVNDPEYNSFNGKWVVGKAKSAKEAREAVDAEGHPIYANCVVFEGVTGDRFHVEITDGDGTNGYNNGKDRAGIAGIQVKGRLHKQDVAASTDIVHGGNDNINTQGGDDIVVGGTGADKIRTFGDDRYGIYDNDVVYGDNAKMVFTDRDSNLNTASTISYAESIASKNLSANYNDTIMTGDGNDVVVGGSGNDNLDSGATAQADEKLDGLEVFSLNFTDVSSNQSTLISKGEAAGVVADNDWHNAYLYNGQSRVHEVDRNNDEDTEKALQKITFQYDCYGNTSAPTEVTNASMDADTGNNKMMMNYVGGHNQDSLTVRLNNIPEKFTANKYDVYVYIDGINNDSDAHGYVFKITGPKGKTYYLNDWSGNRFDGEFKEVTCTEYNRDMFKDGVTPSVEMIGNYVVFRDVDSKEFTVTLECFETTYGTQRRNDLPVISAVQLVAGANRKADIAVGGDHDKDFVVGDDATLHFDLDIPFAGDESIGDYQNRLVSAKSTSVSGSANSDKIWTGKDRDVVIGGEGNDQIDAGAGDDVVIGNTVKSVYVEHNNPVGVFRPNVNIVLEDNDYNVAEPRPYLDGQGGNKDQIRSMVQGGQIEGIKLDNQNTGYDTVYGGNNNKDLVFINGHTEWGNLAKEMTSDSFFGVQKDDVHALPTPPAPAEVDPVSGNEEPTGTDQPISGGEDPVTGNEDPITGNEDPQNEVDYSETIISPVAFADLKLDANKKVKLVFETYPQFNDHIANLHLYFTGKNGKMFDDVTVELYSHGRLYRYDVGGNYWVGVDVQDRIDGDSAYGDGNCVLYIVSEKETAFTLSIGE